MISAPIFRLIIFILVIVSINSTLISTNHDDSHITSAKSEDECKPIVDKPTVTRLKKYLFCEYDKKERTIIPSENGTTYVNLAYAPNLANFNELSGNLELVGSMAVWNDEDLKWEPSSFDNISAFFTRSEKIWVPDIAVLSAGNEDSNEYGLPSAMCYIHKNGRTWCAFNARLTIRCQTDFTNWPYDRQNCSLVISSWSQTQENIRFMEQVNETLFMHFFQSNGEWQVTVSRVFYDQRKSFFVENATSSRVSIDFILDRVHNQLSGRYISPAIIMTVVTLTTLWLDPGSIERLTVAYLNPVIHLLCIKNLHWALPHNGSTVPGLLLFYANSLVLATIALLLTFCLGKIRETKTPPPGWITSLTASVLRTRAGQIFLLCMLDPKVAAQIEPDANDAGDLVPSAPRQPDWAYFTVLCGWISFSSFLFVYAILYAVLVPNSSMRTPITDILHVYNDSIQ